MPHPTRTQRIDGALYGLAYGDAWGYPQEFKSWSQIVNDSIVFPSDALVSDDTQMSLYVIAAAIADLQKGAESEILAFGRGEEDAADEIRVKMGEYLLFWLKDPDNNRAPGNTCMGSLRRLARTTPLTGLEGTNDGSKGNGANIRAPWLGLLELPNDLVGAIAAIQSSVTHNHPLALASAAITAILVRGLFTEDIRPGSLYTYARTQLELLRQSPLAQLLPSPYMSGLDELETFLLAHRGAYHEFVNTGSEQEDVCAYFGEGWVAEEALLSAIALADRYTLIAPTQALYRAANSGGDSDSIAAITGAFVGAGYGSDAFPQAWRTHLEPRYQRDLKETLELLAAGKPELND